MKKLCFWLGVVIVLISSGDLVADEIPIIDAHSQAEKAIPLERIITLMDMARVSHTILAARRGTSIRDIVNFAARHPDRITAAVRSKGAPYQERSVGKFRKYLRKQLKHPEFTAMAEVLIFHHEKRNKKGRLIAPEVSYPPDNERVQIAFAEALKRGWPFIAHIEFTSLGDKLAPSYMAKFERMMRDNPGHPFVLIHMAQLQAAEVGRLLAAHPNLHFIPAHVNPITAAHTREPWGNIFEGESLAPVWKNLILAYPDRFILGFDNVWKAHWEKWYIPQVKLWRKALAELPDAVAHAVAHKNAERLWGIPPVK